MSKPRGKCAFCGKPGLTHGHIWPDWLGQVLPYTATHHEQEIGRFETFKPQVPGPEHSIRIRQGQARSRKPRNTCGACNSGWMSQIENLAKPYLSALILGQRAILSPFAQYAVACLIALIVMRVELLGGNIPAISPAERDHLRLRRWLSEHWHIWIVAFAGENQQDHFSKNYAAQLEPAPTDKVGPEHCNVQVSTLVMGQLCAHTFHSPVVETGGYEGVSLYQLWPLSPLPIDTGYLAPLNDREVLWLHEAYARESTPMPRQ